MCVSACVCAFMSVCLSVRACLYVCLSGMCVRVCVRVRLSVCLSVCAGVCACLPACMSACLSVCPDFPIQCNNSEIFCRAKALLLFRLLIRWSGTFVNLKEQFDNMSYRLSLLRFQSSNLKATVTHQKCTIVSNFDFDTLPVELGPYGSLSDETNSKNNCHARN